MPDVCHQKLARDRHAPEGPPPVEIDLGTAVVRPVTRDFARHLMLPSPKGSGSVAVPERFAHLLTGAK